MTNAWPTPEDIDGIPSERPAQMQNYLAARQRIRDNEAAAAAAAVQRVRDLHHQAPGGLCVHCAPGQQLGYDVTWPCDTIRAVDGTLVPAAAEQPIPYALVDVEYIRSWSDLLDSGLLWLINRAVFHPYGRGLALHYDHTGQPCGWTLLRSEDGTPWQFDAATDAEGYRAAMATLNVRHQP